jgi:hypothetical protein
MYNCSLAGPWLRVADTATLSVAAPFLPETFVIVSRFEPELE